tara:strand:+ start:396 stop:578 length:183 start_codon:yes stop_codon:yes gene_type:complete
MSHYPNQLRSIVAPSGATARPVIREVRLGNEIRTEAHYTDPKTGQFITKIPVSVRKVDDK